VFVAKASASPIQLQQNCAESLNQGTFILYKEQKHESRSFSKYIIKYPKLEYFATEQKNNQYLLTMGN
jgi:hypothetical protein